MKKCKLIIKDQCNIKFEGLDPIARKKLAARFRYTDPNGRFSHAFKLKRWDGKVPFFTAAGSSYFNLLEEIIPMVVDFGYDIEIEDHRPDLDWKFPEITDEYLADKTWPEGHPMAGDPIMLREHQVNAINMYMKNWNAIAKISTGAGKTISCAAMSKLIEETTGGRSIVIVPSISLILQTEDDYKNIGLDCGVFYGQQKDIYKKHTICTWQSLSVMNKKGIKRIKTKKGNKAKYENMPTYDPDFDISGFLKDVVCVIVDEAHILPGKEVRDLLCGPLAHIPLRWGMTGTVPKLEHQFAAVLSAVGPVMYETPASELIEKGILSRPFINILQMQLKKKTEGDFIDWDAEKKFINTNKEIMQWMADTTIDMTESYGSTLLLVENIETGKILEKLIPDSVFVYGNVDVDDRKIEYKKVDSNKNKIIIATYGVAAVGINMTFLFNVVLFNSGKSFTRIVQSIGRGLRKGKSEKNDMIKDTINIFDVCSDLKYSKRHLSARKSYYKDEEYPFALTKVEVDI